MEIVLLARKHDVEQDKLIKFESVWGLPAKGENGGVIAVSS